MENQGKKNLTRQINLVIDKNFQWIIWLIIILVLAVGYFMLIKDQFAKLNQSRRVDLAALAGAVERLTRDNDYMTKNIDKTVEFSPVEERLLGLALPDQFNFPSLIIQLSNLSARFGFVVSDIGAKESVGISKSKNSQSKTALVENDNSQLKKVSVDMTIIGSNYDNFKNFIGATENSVLFFDVLSVKFKPDGGVAQKYTLSFFTYYFQAKN